MVLTKKKILFSLFLFSALLALPFDGFRGWLRTEAPALETSTVTDNPARSVESRYAGKSNFGDTEAAKISFEDPFAFWQLLKESQISFEKLSMLPFFIPTLKNRQEPIVIIEKYNFSHATRVFRMEGRFREQAHDTLSDLEVTLAALKKEFSEALFTSIAGDATFTIEAKFPEFSLPKNFARAPSGLDIFRFEKAVPQEIDKNLLKNAIQPLLQANRLKLEAVGFPETQRMFEDAPLQPFLLFITAEGFATDGLQFLSMIQKHGRFFTIEYFSITVTEIRSGISIGKLETTLAAYSRK